MEGYARRKARVDDASKRHEEWVERQIEWGRKMKKRDLKGPDPVPPYGKTRQHDLDAWAISCLRHECTRYDDTLIEATGTAYHDGPLKAFMDSGEADRLHVIIKDRALHEIIRRFQKVGSHGGHKIACARVWAAPCHAGLPPTCENRSEHGF